MTDLKLLDVREVAQVLGIAVRTVWRLSATGELPQPVRIGARVGVLPVATAGGDS